MQMTNTDVIVAGGGNAALCAALSAAKAGASVVVLEAADRSESGGNSWFTDGAMRFAFSDFAALVDLLRLSDAEAAVLDIPPYPAENYFSDLQKAGGSETALMRTLAQESLPTMHWLRDGGVPLELVTDNQSHESGGRRRFFGNLCVRSVGRGIGLVDALRTACEEQGVVFCYGTRVRELIMQDGLCTGVFADTESGRQEFRARAVVLACGGFEANAQKRAEHLGEEWRGARVRGTRHNVGDGLDMALAAGAAQAGDWRRCHAVGTDFNSPPTGDFSLPGDIWKKHSYPYGIMMNKNGLRFVDEGADLRNYTYARYGREILRQPEAVAWQVFDAQTEPLLRSEYRHERVARWSADSPEALAENVLAQMEMNAPQFLRTWQDFNEAAARAEAAFNPAIKDGRCASGLPIDKSHWALPITQAPFLAFAVTCGITFTFGGVKADSQAQVLDGTSASIGGLFAAGEMIGGLFGDNYPGGSGLMSGAVFGRIAGENAAQFAQKTP